MADFAEIQRLMGQYFRILHEGDTKGISQMFLPEARLFFPQADGKMVQLSLPEYIDLTKSRTSPKAADYPKFGRVVLIDQSSPMTALVKVECAVQPRYFIDYLSLVKTGSRWMIASKVYCLTTEREIIRFVGGKAVPAEAGGGS